MNRIVLRIFAILLIISGLQTASAQRFLGSVVAGANVTKVDGDEVDRLFNKFGVNAGGAVSLYLEPTHSWTATLELLYSQKGSYSKAYFDTTVYAPSMYQDIDHDYAFNPNIKYRLELDYVEIPLSFHYEHAPTGWAIGAGVSWGRLVRAKEIDLGFRRTTNVRSKHYNKNDWSVFADVRARIWKGLKFNVRFQYSFVPIRTRDFQYIKGGSYISTETRKQYNFVLSFRLIYIINERFVRNEKGKWTKDLSDVRNEIRLKR